MIDAQGAFQLLTAEVKEQAHHLLAGLSMAQDVTRKHLVGNSWRAGVEKSYDARGP